jgi:hypothetical protein
VVPGALKHYRLGVGERLTDDGHPRVLVEDNSQTHLGELSIIYDENG